MKFKKNNQYTRSEIWKTYHPNTGEKPRGGNWDTGYVIEGDDLIAFLNINSAGRTGHDFDNAYDSETEQVVWFGKPNTRSTQSIFQRLLSGKLIPHFFARWDSKNTRFLYLGIGIVKEYKDAVPINETQTAIRLLVSLVPDAETIGAEGIPDLLARPPSFAKKMTMLVNRYERDPSKRIACLDHYGYDCQVCGFSFQKAYGELGREFIHVHHIEPLGEVGGEGDICPKRDLIPVCANCHAMLHREVPALKPAQLQLLLKSA
jgi:5-methylcytosine-specific restriction protein A